MKKTLSAANSIRFFACLLIIAIMLLSCSCGKRSSIKALTIGTEGITGNFNPFYADSEGDKKVMEQIFRTIQYRGTDNKLVNSVGSITYSYEDNEKIKYTVTIKDNLFFSDGTNVTIDDVIFFYYFIADAKYDGVYSDFYLNDIEGLKEYYYDDVNYEKKLSSYKGKPEGLEAYVKKYIEKNYSDGIDVNEITGIKRVDDYTCTLLYNSGNINAVSQINAVIVSKAFYAAGYVKGNVESVKAICSTAMGCGPYYLSGYEEATAVLDDNKYSREPQPDFRQLKFLDLPALGKGFYESISDGYVDIISTFADSSNISSLAGKDVSYFINDSDEYVSLDFNTKKLTNPVIRRALIRACDVYGVIDSTVGSYYTKVYRPLSVRFEEYPENAEPYYPKSEISSLTSGEIPPLTAVCVGSENSLDALILNAYSEQLAKYGVKLTVKLCAKNEFDSLVSSGKADIWISHNKDGATCDRYDYYHTGGKLNFTGISDPAVDTATEQIRSGIGFFDKKSQTAQLMTLIMEQAVELPLYQLQTVTVYNAQKIDIQATENIGSYDGYGNVISMLKCVPEK